MAWRYLKHNKACWGPQHCVFVDTESRRECYDGRPQSSIERFRLGVASYSRLRAGKPSAEKWCRFNRIDVFWKWLDALLKPKETLWLFAHSLGFDSRQLDFWRLLDAGIFTRVTTRISRKTGQPIDGPAGVRTGMLVTADPPVVVEAWTADGRRLLMVDSLNYFSCSLATLGNWLQLPKLDMPDPWDDDERWFTYCHRDVEILRAVMLHYIRWVSQHDLGIFSITLPSQAMHGYRHTMMVKSIVLHDEEGVKQLEGESHYGGEIFVGYVGRVAGALPSKQMGLFVERDTSTTPATRYIHQLDSNSLFPAVMAANQYPCRLVDWGAPNMGSRSLVRTLDASCIAECLVKSDTTPVYCRRGGRSGRYVGLFVTVLCGPELAAALEAGIVVAVRRWARYQLADLFSGWVEKWWQQRFMYKLAGDRISEQLCKRVMNSLYGKFAQHSYEWVDQPGVAAPMRWGCWFDLDARTETCKHFRAIAGVVQTQSIRSYHPNSFPAIAAFVCSHARERMRYLRTVAGEKQVYYQGVDSLYTSDLGLERLRDAGEVDSAALGKLRLEASEISADFCGHGLYRIGQRWCRTSIRRGALEVMPGEWQQDNFERLGAALGRLPEHGVVIDHVKRLTAAANPVGIIDRDGWTSPQPAVWGEHPAETTDPKGFYDDDLGNRNRAIIEIGECTR